MYQHIYKEIQEALKINKEVRLHTTLARHEGDVKKELKRICCYAKSEKQSECDEERAAVKSAFTFDEIYYQQERLIILGGGHIAIPLVDIGRQLGFQVVVIDDRINYANKQRFPNATQVICNNFNDGIEQIKPTINDYYIIVTRGHKHDAECLRKIFQYEESIYTGMIGSKRRVKDVFQELSEEGLDAERLSRIHSPIGLNIGAITPNEISVAILAEIIQTKRSARTNKYYKEDAEMDAELWNALTDMKVKNTALVTIIETKGSVPRKKGAKMLVFKDGRILGTIGGGCSEADIVLKARGLIGTQKYQVALIDMTGIIAEDAGMVCGGVMKVLIEDWN